MIDNMDEVEQILQSKTTNDNKENTPMSQNIDKEGSKGLRARIKYAAKFIESGIRPTTRSFDTCFEMDDGELVYNAILAMAKTNKAIAANFEDYLTPHEEIKKLRVSLGLTER